MQKGKTFYYIITCAAPTEDYADTMLAALRGFVSCAPEAKEGGYILACNTHDAGDVKDTEMMKKAFEMGQKV